MKVNMKMIRPSKLIRILSLILILIFIIITLPAVVLADGNGTLTITAALPDNAPYGDKFRFHVNGKDDKKITVFDLWVTLENKEESGGTLSTTLLVPLNVNFTVQQVLSTEYETSSTNPQQITLNDSNSSGTVSFTNTYHNGLGYFRSHDVVEKEATAENIYSVKAAAALNTELKNTSIDAYTEKMGISDASIEVNLGSGYKVLGEENITVEGGMGTVKNIDVSVVSGNHIVTVYLDAMYTGDEQTAIKILVYKTSAAAVFPVNDVTVYEGNTAVPANKVTVSGNLTP